MNPGSIWNPFATHYFLDGFSRKQRESPVVDESCPSTFDQALEGHRFQPFPFCVIFDKRADASHRAHIEALAKRFQGGGDAVDAGGVLDVGEAVDFLWCGLQAPR